MRETSESLLTRRRVLKTALAAGASCGLGGSVEAHLPQQGSLKPGSVVVFQGDSVTDCGRNRKHTGPNDSGAFGDGFPYHIASRLLAIRPSSAYKFYNRGISGNRVPDLEESWQKDALDLKPDLLSILIGVNDLWHKLEGEYDGLVEQYEAGLSGLIERTKKALPKTRLVLCAPFALRCRVVTDKWFPEFDKRQAVARRLCKQADATWVPFQIMFNAACAAAKADYWAPDGVHPSMGGHALMANVWIQFVKP